MPSASPLFSGYVEWEAKRGKWSKRWLQLREHSLYLSKRDNVRSSRYQLTFSSSDDSYSFVIKSSYALYPILISTK
jgi:hypothetical protein